MVGMVKISWLCCYCQEILICTVWVIQGSTFRMCQPIEDEKWTEVALGEPGDFLLTHPVPCAVSCLSCPYSLEFCLGDIMSLFQKWLQGRIWILGVHIFISCILGEIPRKHWKHFWSKNNSLYFMCMSWWWRFHVVMTPERFILGLDSFL